MPDDLRSKHGDTQAARASDLGPQVEPPICALLIDGVLVLAIGRVRAQTRGCAITVDGAEFQGVVLPSPSGESAVFAGHAPAALADRHQLDAIRLAVSAGQAPFWTNRHPVSLSQSIDSAMSRLGDEMRVFLLDALLRCAAEPALGNDSGFLTAVSTLVRDHSKKAEASSFPFDDRTRYCRFLLPAKLAGLDHTAAVPTTLYLQTDSGFQSLSCPSALVTAGENVHLLIQSLAAGQHGTLYVSLPSAVYCMSVPAQTPNRNAPAIEEIVARSGVDGVALKLYLLARCAEIYRRTRSEQTLNAGNLAWAYTNFPYRAYVRPEMEFGISIENILPVPGKGALVIGWMWDPHHLLEGLYIRDGLGRRGKISATLYRYDRPDVREVFKASQAEPAGFVAFQPFEFADDLWPTYQVHGVLKGGVFIDLATDIKASRRFLAKPETLLSLVPPEKFSQQMLAALAPAIAYQQTKSIKQAGIRRVVHYGKQSANPKLSIVVPLYKRIDHARHQLVHFANDPEFENIEIIYVLDYPDLEPDLDLTLGSLTRIYKRAATLAVMQENSGFAGATNAGASIARGKYLLLLNSDVIPDQPGWCSKLWSVLERHDDIGAVGARLLYEDGSIQHAGMAYESDQAGNWKIMHPGKGLMAGHPGEPASGPVPAVTAACMMMPNDLYKQLGGLNQDYVIGDFEDSDLCMKIAAVPKTLWYCADATLYHLERQSMGTDGRYTPATWRYNQMLHQGRWNRLIEKSRAVTAR